MNAKSRYSLKDISKEVNKKLRNHNYLSENKTKKQREDGQPHFVSVIDWSEEVHDDVRDSGGSVCN